MKVPVGISPGGDPTQLDLYINFYWLALFYSTVEQSFDAIFLLLMSSENPVEEPY